MFKKIKITLKGKLAKAEKVPNKITKTAIEDARSGKVIRAKSVDEIFKSI